MPVATACPVCGGADCPVIIEGVDEELRAADIGSSRARLSHGSILRCRKCQFAFRRYRPGGDELARLYREADIEVYERERGNRARTALRHRQLVLREHPEPGSVLDVGCASGQFLRSMAEVGWLVSGVEPSTAEFRLARAALPAAAHLQNTTLKDAAFCAQFDVITFWDVLEHMPEPTGFLRRCAALLKPGGVMLFTTPNIDSWQARCLKTRWPLLLAEHLNYFNPHSLARCCEDAGIHVSKVGVRPVSFSADYVLFRLGQHQLPGMKILRRIAQSCGVARLSLPIYMGEMVAVCQHARSADIIVSCDGYGAIRA